MRVYDFRCDDCSTSFEAFVRSVDEPRECPQCGSSRSTLRPNLQVAIHTSNTRRGRVIDMSSNACPCGSASRGHVHR